MSHVRIASVALAGLVLSTLGATAPQAPTAASLEQALQIVVARNSALEARNRDLEQQVKTLQTQLADYQKSQEVPEPKSLPPGWKSGKFNGMTVYIVPCDADNGTVEKTVKLLDK
jgi:hypothetical protein